MSWLVNELVKCEYDGTAAHIMAHIPPGDIECLEGWAKNYYRVVNRFFFNLKFYFFNVKIRLEILFQIFNFQL